MFRLISVSSKYKFQSLLHAMFHLISVSTYTTLNNIYLNRETNLIKFLDTLHF